MVDANRLFKPKRPDRRNGSLPQQQAEIVYVDGVPVNIVCLFPDSLQPRRAIPSVIASQWDGDPLHTMWLFNTWLSAIAQSLNISFDETFNAYKSIINSSTEEVEIPEDAPAIVIAFAKLVALSASIRDDGQINSIVAVKETEDRYLIESGERRWLAFHLLYFFTQDQKWLHIRVRLVDKLSRFRQAAENVARSDLNMIARARQFSLLLMELWEQEGRRFDPHNAFNSDREFYAQISALSIPDGKTQEMFNALSVNNKASLSQYRKVLSLEDAAWQKADDEDWSRSQIEDWLTAVNPPVVEGGVKQKTNRPTIKTPVLVHNLTKQFEREWKKGKNHAELLKELDYLERWIVDKRNQLR